MASESKGAWRSRITSNVSDTASSCALPTRKRTLPAIELAAASWIISTSVSMPRPRPKNLAS
jgi:hypothetical protein